MEIIKMKIKNYDGTISDTDKMDDFSAELVEKCDEVGNFFKDRGVTFYLRCYNHNKKQCGGAVHIGATNEEDANKASALLTQIKVDLQLFTGLTFIAVNNDDNE